MHKTDTTARVHVHTLHITHVYSTYTKYIFPTPLTCSVCTPPYTHRAHHRCTVLCHARVPQTHTITHSTHACATSHTYVYSACAQPCIYTTTSQSAQRTHVITHTMQTCSEYPVSHRNTTAPSNRIPVCTHTPPPRMHSSITQMHTRLAVLSQYTTHVCAHILFKHSTTPIKYHVPHTPSSHSYSHRAHTTTYYVCKCTLQVSRDLTSLSHVPCSWSRPAPPG